MNSYLCLLFGACLLNQVNAELRISRGLIESAVNDAMVKVDNDFEYSRTESVSRLRRQTATPSDILRLLKQPSGQARSVARAAIYTEQAIHLIAKRTANEHRIAKRSINATDLISEEDLRIIADLTGCSARARPPSCPDTPYSNKFRPATSACNNRADPRQGSSNIPFVRWLPAEYEDGISLPKGWDPNLQINNFLLPMVREVSNRIMKAANEEVQSDDLYTHLVTIFGQWTDHDLTFTPHSPSIRSFSNGINCEDSCERTEPCFPIKIPQNDPTFSNTSAECIPFFRSAPACGSGNTGHLFGSRNVREQMNTLTAFLDVGQVYGSEESKAHNLRDLTSDKGLLRVNDKFTDNGRELLPFGTMGANMCANRARITNDPNAQEVPCFIAGDERSNENIGLTSLHTLMLREHNRLARALAKINPHWNGERLYQEARKIMGGYFQVITFRDYLLHIVGPNFIASQLSNYPGYDENVDPSISNVFATAAYRFAHLMVQPFMFRLDEQYNDHPMYPTPLLHRAFFTPWRIVFEGGIDPVLRGLVGRKAKLNTQEKMMNAELRNRLFEFSSKIALDLAALNLQRGRDHGLPGYNKWRRFCGLSEPKTLEQLAVVLNSTSLATKLLELYGTPDNIDIFLGGVAEPFVYGGRVGPLFACLISQQFRKIRQGDRLWWENYGVFTNEQRESLRTTSLARIICDNTGITDVPDKPFQYRPRGAGYTKCSDIPAFDLSPWKDNGSDTDSGSRGPAGPPGPMGPRGLPGPAGPPGPTVSVAFATRLGNNYPKAGRPIAFREIIYNGQNSYNLRTGKFTCPQAGVYEFEFHCTFYQNTGNVDLRRNGELAFHSFTTQYNGYITASGGILLQLKKGDEIWLSANYGGNGLTADSYFYGHLVFIV